jgi:hypothetical protein
MSALDVRWQADSACVKTRLRPSILVVRFKILKALFGMAFKITFQVVPEVSSSDRPVRRKKSTVIALLFSAQFGITKLLQPEVDL